MTIKIGLLGAGRIGLTHARAFSGIASAQIAAIFDPVGLRGLAYWYSLYPLHAVIFHGMLSRIVDQAVRQSQSSADQAAMH